MGKRIPNGAYKDSATASRMAKRDCTAETYHVYQTEYGWGWFGSDSDIADEWRKTNLIDGHPHMGVSRAIDTGFNSPAGY